jgi:hypothetical protein
LERKLGEHVGGRVDQRVVQDRLVDVGLGRLVRDCRSSRSS